MKTQPNTYPLWESELILIPERGKIEYKYVVMRDENLVRWEMLDHYQNHSMDLTTYIEVAIYDQEGLHQMHKETRKPHLKVRRSLDPAYLFKKSGSEELKEMTKFKKRKKKQDYSCEKKRSFDSNFESHFKGISNQQLFLVKRINK
jgi:hypothetical protein